jgi:hypothetical protein
VTTGDLLALGVGLIAASLIVAVGLVFASGIKSLIEYLRK